jgi:hypothetical protein
LNRVHFFSVDFRPHLSGGEPAMELQMPVVIAVDRLDIVDLREMPLELA